MGSASQHSPSLLFLAAFSADEDALAWARQQSEEQWGPIALAGAPFVFDQTDYYRATMGEALQKVFYVFERPFDPSELAKTKLLTNRWEEQYKQQQRQSGDLQRPLNLDPGYVTEAKLVLATTKDRDHRIYLRDGIFAEVTLYWRQKGWRHSAWTYPDYQLEQTQEFLTAARDYLRRRKREAAPASGPSGAANS